MTSRERLLITPTLLLAVTLATSLVAAPVMAASPDFIGTSRILKNADFSLTANFKAAGLANIVSQAFLSSSGGTADLQCVNPGGNNPPPKRVDFGPLQGQITTIQPKNGQITANATIGPPPLPVAAQICPNKNWNIDILSLTYFNLVLNIQQNGVEILTFNFKTVDP
jgi:hypothetical protein